MTDLMHTLNRMTIVGNELWRVMVLFLILLLAFVGGRLTRYFLTSSAGSLRSRGREITAVTLEALARSVMLAFVSIALKISLTDWLLAFPPGVQKLAGTVTSVLMPVAIGYVLYCLVDVVDAWLCGIVCKTESRMDDMLMPVVRKSLRITIVVLVVLQVATVLSDKPLTSILAGLGVGGLAVALAAQDTLKNFFGSLVILSDKPFELGDRIQVDGFDGTVEEVGFRSTRVRTLEGYLVTVPNGELANKVITNIGKRPHIRRLANITITYDTPPEKVARAKEIIFELLADHEGMHPDFPPRVFFNEFNADSLNILVLYWYHPADFWMYSAFSDRFNTELLKRFNEEGIEFAFPTRTLYLAGDPARPLAVGIERPGDVAGGT